MGFFFGAT
uniref:Uncharacterized protein n=1 Tax=Rhizophora mucronata TaxID=61149 RepID=A0A2P2IQY1_RHIMU